MISFFAGMLYANGAEWVIHKYVLHDMGKKKNSFWRFHWAEHHKYVRQDNFFDKDYKRPLTEWNAQSKEVLGLVGLGISQMPWFFINPMFASGIMHSLFHYYEVHKKSHLDPEWAKKNLPWHYDHHMAKNQDANWGVTAPWFDYIMGTREKFLGTQAEKIMNEKMAKIKERKMSSSSATSASKQATFAES